MGERGQSNLNIMSTLLSRIRQRQESCRGLLRAMGPASARPLRTAVLFRHLPGWGAGIAFYRMFVRCLAMVAEEEGLELGLLVDPAQEAAAGSGLRDLPGQRWRILLSQNGEPRLAETVSAHQIDVLIDLYDSSPWVEGPGIVSWIPDFQHLHLPGYFTAEELQWRNQSFAERALKADHILCSSESVAADFRTFSPAQTGKEWVARFPSNLIFEELPAESPESVLAKYRLPSKFALVANQFWSHKNHQVVIEGAALAKTRGLEVPIVLTGIPVDYRDPSNATTSGILQSVARAGLSGQVIPLGQVPYRDLIQLMRAAALIVQPSRFEGWSTIVQDAKALGKPVACSDIPVHREQAPEGSRFFGCDSPEEVAQALAELWPGLPESADLSTEPALLKNHFEEARAYGRLLASIARSAALAARSRLFATPSL